MAKEIKNNENGTITVVWLDGSSDTWKPSDDVNLKDYKELGAEVRRYAGL